MKTISAADANRHFSSLLRDVATGEVVTVVSRGKPVAVISAANQEDASKLQAHRVLLQDSKASLQLALEIGRVTSCMKDKP